jgi:hypothetical protein
MTTDTIYQEVVDFLEQLDEEDLKHIIVTEEELIEPVFRWEYQFESITETESLFRMVRPFD